MAISAPEGKVSHFVGLCMFVFVSQNIFRLEILGLQVFYLTRAWGICFLTRQNYDRRHLGPQILADWPIFMKYSIRSVLDCNAPAFLEVHL